MVAGEAGRRQDPAHRASSPTSRPRPGRVVLAGGCIDLGDGALPYAPGRRGAPRARPPRRPTSSRPSSAPARAELARLVPDLGPSRRHRRRPGLSWVRRAGCSSSLLGVLDATRRDGAGGPHRRGPPLVGPIDARPARLPRPQPARRAGSLLVLTYRSDELHRRHPLLPFLAELERSGRRRAPGARAVRPAASRPQQLRAIAGHDLDPDLIESDPRPVGRQRLLRRGAARRRPPSDGRRAAADARATCCWRASTELAEPTPGVAARRVGRRPAGRPGRCSRAAVGARRGGALRRAARVRRAGRSWSRSDGRRERYAFRHALLQEAVYDDLLPGERTRLHAAFAADARGEPRPAIRPAPPSSPTTGTPPTTCRARSSPRSRPAAPPSAATPSPRRVAQYERALELWDQVPDAETGSGTTGSTCWPALAGVARFHDASRAVTPHPDARSSSSTTTARPGPGRPAQRAPRSLRLDRRAGRGREGGLPDRGATDPGRAAVRGARPGDGRASPRSCMLGRQVRGVADLGERRAGRGTRRRRPRHRGPCPQHPGHRPGDARRDRRGLERPAGRARRSPRRSASSTTSAGRYANSSGSSRLAGRLEEAVEAAPGRHPHDRAPRADAVLRHPPAVRRSPTTSTGSGAGTRRERALRRAADIGPLGINEILEQELLARLAMARGRFAEAAERLASPGAARRARRGRPVHRTGPGEPDRARACGRAGRTTRRRGRRRPSG